jgi:hypothetical protein
MENLISPNTFGLIIQAVVAIIVAIITYVLGPVVTNSLTKNPKTGKAQPSQAGKLVYVIAGGGSAAISFALIGLVLNAFSPKPSVAITDPAMNQAIEVRTIDTGPGSFTVSGISAEVFSDPDLRVYVLVHPADPPAAGWWIQQPATVEQNNSWSTIAWIGSKDFPPHAGDKIDLLVVVTKPENVIGFVNVSDPKDIKPLAQSNIIRVSISATK